MGKQVFPGEYPYVVNEDGSRSNIRTTTVGVDDRHYVLPSMVQGTQYYGGEPFDIAKSYGLHKYPSFETPEEADAYSRYIHDKVDEQGREILPATSRNRRGTTRQERG